MPDMCTWLCIFAWFAVGTGPQGNAFQSNQLVTWFSPLGKCWCLEPYFLTALVNCKGFAGSEEHGQWWMHFPCWFIWMPVDCASQSHFGGSWTFMISTKAVVGRQPAWKVGGIVKPPVSQQRQQWIPQPYLCQQFSLSAATAAAAAAKSL